MNWKKYSQPGFIFLSLLVLFTAFMRWVPHPPNVTPVAALALFGGAYFQNKWQSFIVPLFALLISDLGLELFFGMGLHNMMFGVYAAFAIIILIGFYLRNNVKVRSVVIGVLGSSVAFFLVTNFTVWLTSGMYAKSLSGLSQCYIAALPFFRNSLLGNLVYSAALFGIYEWVKMQYPRLRLVPVKQKSN